VASAEPLVHVGPVSEVVGPESGDLACFVVRGRRPVDGTAEEDHLVFLADLPVGVGDDVTGV
jgi:hypothetical protein